MRSALWNPSPPGLKSSSDTSYVIEPPLDVTLEAWAELHLLLRIIPMIGCSLRTESDDAVFAEVNPVGVNQEEGTHG